MLHKEKRKEDGYKMSAIIKKMTPVGVGAVGVAVVVSEKGEGAANREWGGVKLLLLLLLLLFCSAKLS